MAEAIGCWKKQPKTSLQKQVNLTRIEEENIDVMKTWAIAQYHIYSVSGKVAEPLLRRHGSFYLT